MTRPPLKLPLTLAVIAFLFAPMVLPQVRLVALAPFLAIICLRKTFLTALWVGLSMGLLIDLSNTTLPFGLFSLTYTLLAAFSFLIRKWFFEENPLLLSLYVGLISMSYSALELSLMSLFGSPLSFHFSGLFSQFFLMPVVDSIYAFFWFCCPMMGYTVWKRRRQQKSPY